MEITCNNFKQQYGYIEEVIKNASFVAIDIEFLGLEADDVNRRCSLFDSPQERYSKTRYSVKKFPPAQLGLAFFTALEGDERYKVDVFTIYLFKAASSEPEFAFSVSSLSFLSDHGFDFNKLARHGVPHLNLDELHRVLDRFHQTNGIEVFGAHLPLLLSHLQRTVRTEVARMRRRSTGSEGAEQHPLKGVPIAITQPLSDLQKAALLYKLQGCTPGIILEFQGNVLTINSGTCNRRAAKKKLFEQITSEIFGASDVILAIIEARLPVVGHNAFRDMLYIYEYFVGDLPETLDEFKKSINTVFPVIIDTKIIAEECKDRLSWHGVMNYRLESLNAFFERMSADLSLPTPLYMFAEGVERKFSNPNWSGMHDAGVDSVSTGQTFIRLAHLISVEERPMERCASFRRLLYAARPLANRLPVPLLGVPYVNLLGAEPPSRNPDAIILEMIAKDDTAGLGALRRELRGKFGRWRCDVRCHGDNRIHVATNTDTTYWRVFKYYSMHPDYRVLSLPSASSSASTSSDDIGSNGGDSAILPALAEPTTAVRPTIELKLPLCMSQLLFEMSAFPALKWWCALATCFLAAQMMTRRSHSHS